MIDPEREFKLITLIENDKEKYVDLFNYINRLLFTITKLTSDTEKNISVQKMMLLETYELLELENLRNLKNFKTYKN